LSPELRASLNPFERAVPPALAEAPPPSRSIGGPDWVRVAAEEVTPAVVDIHTEGKAIPVPQPFSDDPFFRRFFGLPAPREQEERIVPRGAGSGFIISRDG